MPAVFLCKPHYALISKSELYLRSGLEMSALVKLVRSSWKLWRDGFSLNSPVQSATTRLGETVGMYMLPWEQEPSAFLGQWSLDEKKV